MDSAKLIAVGGGDKRVHLINSESRQPLEPVISGHAGSVKCVLINEKQGFVISGSFDTSIRYNYSTCQTWMKKYVFVGFKEALMSNVMTSEVMNSNFCKFHMMGRLIL